MLRARACMRVNLIQHDGADTASEWNHSRHFVGRAFNWIMCNNGYHTIHHNRAGLHCTLLCLWPPVFGTLSKLGAFAAVLAFNLFQLLGKLHHDAIQPPSVRTLDGAWARPKGMRL